MISQEEQAIDDIFGKVKFLISKAQLVDGGPYKNRHQVEDNFDYIWMWEVPKTKTISDLRQEVIDKFYDSYGLEIDSSNTCFVNRSNFDLSTHNQKENVILEDKPLGLLFQGIPITVPIVIEILPKIVRVQIKSRIGNKTKKYEKDMKIYASVGDIYVDFEFWVYLAQGYIQEKIYYTNILGKKQSLKQILTQDHMAKNLAKTQSLKNVWKIVFLRYAYIRLCNLNVNFHEPIILEFWLRQKKDSEDYQEQFSNGISSSLQICANHLVPSWRTTLDDFSKLYNGVIQTQIYQQKPSLEGLFKFDEETLKNMNIQRSENILDLGLQLLSSNVKGLYRDYRSQSLQDLYLN